MRKEKKYRATKAEIETELCEMLSGNPSPRLLNHAPPFPHRFVVVRPEIGGAPIILVVEDNTARIMHFEYAAGYLSQYVSYLSGEVAELNVTYETCLKVIKAWSRRTYDLTDLPKAVAFKSDKDLCLTRLDFDPVLCDETLLKSAAPMFSEMIGRMTNREAFCMRIGSLFDPSADRKQAVWLSGPPDCGKSQFSWLLTALAGKSYGILSNEDLDTPYWKAQLVGKRVAIVQEAAARFIRRDAFKSITGDDDHSINQKSQPIYYAKIPSILFFFSNNSPDIPNDDALMARIIDCRIDKIEETSVLPQATVRQKIVDEFPFIAGYCIALYERLASGNRIPCSNETLVETVNRYEGDYLDFINHYYVVDPDSYVYRNDFKQDMIEYGFKDSQQQSHCKRVLLTNYDVKELRGTFKTNEKEQKSHESASSNISKLDKRLYVYKGIKKRTETGRQWVSTDKLTLVSWGGATKPKALQVVPND